jgi:hypothetical protein
VYTDYFYISFDLSDYDKIIKKDCNTMTNDCIIRGDNGKITEL